MTGFRELTDLLLLSLFSHFRFLSDHLKDRQKVIVLCWTNEVRTSEIEF